MKNWLKKLNKKYVVRKSEEESMGNKMLLSIVMALGIATFAYFVSSHIIMNRAKSQFENDTQEIVNQINNEVNRYKDLAYSVRSYIANTDQLDKDGFHRYVVSLDFKKFPSLHALNFAQSVFDNELDDYYRHLKIEYENSADTENLNNTILQKLNSKKIVHIKNSEHFIINYFEPNKQGIDFIGKDLSEIPSAKQSLIDGRVNKEVNSTGNLFVGHYEPKDILAAFFRLAVFDQHNPELYRGSIGIGIKLDKSLFGNKNDKYINYRIKASNQSMSQASMVFDSKMPDKNLTEKWSTEPNTSEKLFSIKKPLNLANSNFELYAYTDKMPPNVASINSAYILSVFMFLLSLFLIRRWFTLETDKGRAHKMAERMTQEIRVTAFSDNLTGLANRKCFLDDLNECIEKYPEETLYVMFLDLDGFKKVNDTLGHAAGDVVLKNFAIRLQELAQSEPVKCYRIGGDEFTILLETRLSPIKFKKTHLEELAKNLLLLTKQSFSVSGEDFFLSVSIGIAEYPFDGASAKELFKNSDVAMYETKKRGKNNYVFYSKELSSNLEKKNQMENLLLTAFDKNEFYIVYQPKLERKENKFIMSGAEVLLRWKNEKLGEVSPFQFIPIAEECGFMPKLGLWVFEETVKKLALWKANGVEDVKMSVNLSVHQLNDLNLTKVFLEILNNYGISSKQIIIEITESTMMQDVDSSSGLLKEFRNNGFEISIDDFGTGYSSLSYLRKYPIDEIKIDRSFTKDVLLDKKDRIVIGAIIKLAQELGLNVVVEGVETKEQLEWFDAQGKLQIQGYYFSRPIVEKEFLDFLEKNSNKKLLK